jgi:hypothetical protein
MGRRAARGLVEKDLLVPAQRQQRPPAARKGSHRQHGNADPGKAERRRRDDRRQAEPERQVTHQQLQHGGERLVGGDEQPCRQDDHQDIAAEAQLEAGVKD